MSKKEKLIARFLSVPKDFTYDELRTLLHYFGYEEDAGGNGSRVSFYNEETNGVIKLHKPHPGNIVKPYVIELIIVKLREANLV